jgi:hypothetical protein
MSATRFAQWSFLVLAVSLAALETRAEPILLFELKHVAEPPFLVLGAPPSELDYFFSMVDSGRPSPVAHGLLWHTSVSASDVGRTFEAPQEQVAALNSELTQLSNPDLLLVSGQIQTLDSSVVWGFYEAVARSPLVTGQVTFEAALAVPSLSRYTVTDIERIVDSFYLQEVPFGQNRAYHYGGAQTLRVYGVVVPESTTSLFVLLGVTCYFTNLMVGNTARHRSSRGKVK